MRKWIEGSLIILLAAAGAVAQPTINEDLSVTFRIKAPEAKDVRFGTEAYPTPPPGPAFTRGDDGFWTLTTPPLEPGWYPYGIVVDGLFVIDPLNNNFRPQLTAGNPLNNVIVVRGKEPLVYDYDPKTAKGTVHIETLDSVNFKRSVQCWIYTPPGYETSGKNYPVLYLMHGSPGDAGRWVKFAAADTILDNLLAAGKIQEMIVVMPDAQAPSTTPSNADNQRKDLEVFEKYLLEEIMPLAERKYRVAATPQTRWIAGLSRGGLQTFHVGFKHSDLFSAMGVFSISLPLSFPEGYPAASVINSQVRLLYYSCGRIDRTVPFAAYERSEASLTTLGFNHESAITTQDHTWENFRRELAVFLQKL